jgi:hypothetical protein
MKRGPSTISSALMAMYTLADYHDDALNDGDLEAAEEILHILRVAADDLMETTTPDYFDEQEQKFIVDIVNANFNHYSGENNEVQ